MTEMKLHFSDESGRNGDYKISFVSTRTEYDPVKYVEEMSEFAALAQRVLDANSELSVSKKRTGHIQTIELYETGSGTLVELVDDDFFGVLIESKDRELLKRILTELNLEIQKQT